jgi:hypothetical protein
MQVAAHGKGLEAAGAVGVAELHSAVAGGGAGAVDHGGAGRAGELDAVMAPPGLMVQVVAANAAVAPKAVAATAAQPASRMRA